MRTRSVLLVKHLDYETGGHAARLVSHLPTREAVFASELPNIDELAGVIMFGGDMSAANEAEHPSLTAAMRLARECIDAEVPLLGLCLGHQIIARSLGAVHHEGAAEEVGFVALDIVQRDAWLGGYTGELRPVQWHSDTVELPAGAELIASNDAVPNQAFRYGSALGLQFHLEADERVLRLWNTVSEPPMREELPPERAQTLEADYRANTRLHTVAEAGFTAFASACAQRL